MLFRGVSEIMHFLHSKCALFSLWFQLSYNCLIRYVLIEHISHQITHNLYVRAGYIEVKSDLKKLKIKDQDHFKRSPLVIFSPKRSRSRSKIMIFAHLWYVVQFQQNYKFPKINYSIFGLPGERVQLLPGRRDRHVELQPQGASIQDGIGQEPQLCGPWSDLAEIRTTRGVLRKIWIRDIK